MRAPSASAGRPPAARRRRRRRARSARRRRSRRRATTTPRCSRSRPWPQHEGVLGADRDDQREAEGEAGDGGEQGGRGRHRPQIVAGRPAEVQRQFLLEPVALLQWTASTPSSCARSPRSPPPARSTAPRPRCALTPSAVSQRLRALGARLRPGARRAQPAGRADRRRRGAAAAGDAGRAAGGGGPPRAGRRARRRQRRAPRCSPSPSTPTRSRPGSCRRSRRWPTRSSCASTARTRGSPPSCCAAAS